MSARRAGSLLALASAMLASAAPVTPEASPLVPRRLLFGSPERAGARLSPDGRQLAFLAPVDGVLNIWMAAVATPQAAKPVTHERPRPIRSFQFTPDGRRLLFLRDERGDEQRQLCAVPVQGGPVQVLLAAPGADAAIVATSPRDTRHVLVSLNARDARHADLYRLDLVTGRHTRVWLNEGYASFVVDRDLRPRLGLRQTAQGGFEVDRLGPAGVARRLLTLAPEDALTTRLLGFDTSGRLYALDSRGRDTAALVRLDARTGRTHVLAARAAAEVTQVLLHPLSGAVEAYAVERLRRRWHALGTALAGDLEHLEAHLPGDFEVLDRAHDDQRWLLLVESARQVPSFWLYERPARRLVQLFSTRPALRDHVLADMHPVELPTRDGLVMVSYLSLPPGSDADGDGRPERPLPLVVYTHGGPWTRVGYGFDRLHQWLANRGYAVLAVNYRGSAGFGKAFLEAGTLEFARRMHDDLLDAVEWAVGAGVAQRDKVAIFGESYGGYAALVGLAFSPRTFACAIDLVGPSSLLTLLESFPAFAQPVLEVTWYRRVGDPRTAAGRALLLERSPLTRAARIERPLLMAYGAHDVRVKPQEAEQLVAALRDRQVPVTYLLYPDEGHGFARPQNWLSFFAVAEAFLARWLGGRVEPVGADFVGASLEVRAGAEHVPGLPATASVAAPP
jgi:dipeptidyl aminopeptidase/acylaminoacyl peptidase